MALLNRGRSFLHLHLRCDRPPRPQAPPPAPPRRFFTSSPISRVPQDPEDHYQALELGYDASKSEIKEAFVKLSKQHHPDLNDGKPSDRFGAVADAYKVLNNESRKRSYDLRIGNIVAPSSSSPYRRRNGSRPYSMDEASITNYLRETQKQDRERAVRDEEKAIREEENFRELLRKKKFRIKNQRNSLIFNFIIFNFLLIVLLLIGLMATDPPDYDRVTSAKKRD